MAVEVLMGYAILSQGLLLRRPRDAGDPKGPKPIYGLRRPQGAGDPKGPKPINIFTTAAVCGGPEGAEAN